MTPVLAPVEVELVECLVVDTVMDVWCVGTESLTDSSCTRDLEDIGLEERHSDLRLEERIAVAETCLWVQLK